MTEIMATLSLLVFVIGSMATIGLNLKIKQSSRHYRTSAWYY